MNIEMPEMDARLTESRTGSQGRRAASCRKKHGAGRESARRIRVKVTESDPNRKRITVRIETEVVQIPVVFVRADSSRPSDERSSYEERQ